MAESFERMSLRELVDLREELARVMKRRFERPSALLFTDVVGSTAYLSEHGDVAGRALLQRHHSLLGRVLEEVGGRLIDTAGDGSFCVADSVVEGARALVRLQQVILEDNSRVDPAHRLGVRCGLHWSPVLAEGDMVTGESVHVAARIANTAEAGEIRISETAYRKLPAAMRPLCSPLEARTLKGLVAPVEMLALDWRDPAVFPTVVEIVEAEERHPIPVKNRVGFGRLAEHLGQPANDVVLSHPNPQLARRISRWHLELVMTAEGCLLRALSSASTEVDGRSLDEGGSAIIRPGSTVRLSSALTLRFRGPEKGNETVLGTLLDG